MIFSFMGSESYEDFGGYARLLYGKIIHGNKIVGMLLGPLPFVKGKNRECAWKKRGCKKG
jgi:hypothetical protein